MHRDRHHALQPSPIFIDDREREGDVPARLEGRRYDVQRHTGRTAWWITVALTVAVPGVAAASLL